MKILFAWTGVTSYMADCWRRLQSAQGVELKVVVDNVYSGRAFDVEKVFGGLDYAILSGGMKWDDGGWRPDIIFAVGWHSHIVREIVRRRKFRDVPKVCCFDMPWRWLPRCICARWVLRPFLKNYVAAYVPGQSCARYARWLRFQRIETGLFSIDAEKLRSAHVPSERKGFLYVGRFSSEKRVDLIERAYRRYQELGGSWPLDCYGQGGKFIQPDELPSVYAEHACLLLASEFDPWPLVALEARTAGCEVIMSDRCGNRFELPGVRVVRYGDVEAMAHGMLKLEEEFASRKGGGQDAECNGGVHAALARYDCKAWAERTLRFAGELLGMNVKV